MFGENFFHGALNVMTRRFGYAVVSHGEDNGRVAVLHVQDEGYPPFCVRFDGRYGKYH